VGADSEFTVRVTGYTGLETEVLRLRNQGRDTPRTREYLDWRYHEPGGAPDPEVFWLESEGQAVGMASVVYRRYWVDGRALYLAVLGDITLNPRLRGRGLGQKLLRSVTSQLETSRRSTCGFVIPTAEAQRSLAAVGWQDRGRLITYVLPLDPSARLRADLRDSALAQLFSRAWQTAVAGLLKLRTGSGDKLVVQAEPDESFHSIWEQVEKRDAVMRDRSLATFMWRYVRHPHTRFQFAKFFHGERVAGYVVFETGDIQSGWTIYDLLLARQEDLGALIALFVRECAARAASQLRVTLAETHPYRKQIARTGFIRRDASALWQIHCGASSPSPRRWWITSGDKDI
jgi:GNAT superfamily N-acetyltransferase